MAMTESLYLAATNSKARQLMVVPHGDHNNTYIVAGEEYFMRLRVFFDQCLADERTPDNFN